MAKSSAEYSVLILLPADVEQRLQDWVGRTPGASWPAWGGHVTLLPEFAVAGEPVAVQNRIRRVCSTFHPFSIRLDRVARRRHWRRPQMNAVLLAGRSDGVGGRSLARLHDALGSAVAPVVQTSVEAAGRPFLPHVSLTWGLEDREARALARAARAARLVVGFTVDRIWLLQFVPTVAEPRKVNRIRSFALSRRPTR